LPLPRNCSLPIYNLFLTSLPQDDLKALEPHFESVRLYSHQKLQQAGAPIEYCYFSNNGGMTSLLIGLEDGSMIEAGVVGKEGFSNGASLMGFETSAPYTTMVQMPGMALRILSKVLHSEMLRRPAVLERVHRFTQLLNVQMAHTAACNARHTIQERLARWLLMAGDRAESATLLLTHEFISMMLAVRRPGVTVAARSLQGKGAINYERGRIIVLDRGLLEGAACECYAVVRRHYERVLGWPGG